MSNGRQTGAAVAWPLGVAAAVYAALLATAEKAHTFWRDEAEAWIVARDSHGFGNLLHNVRYEGHPAGWYSVLYGITRFTSNVEWMKLPNMLFAFAAVAMILCAKRVALPVRLGLVFSYFFLFEYAVIDRNYMMGIMCLIAALMMMRSGKSVFGVAAFLSVAALTSAPAMIVAVCFFPLQWMPLVEGKPTLGEKLKALGGRRIAAAALFGVCVLASVSEIRPPKDSGLLLDSQPRKGMVQTLVHPFHDVAKGYLPLPKFQVDFWDTNRIDAISPALFTLLGVVLVVALLLFFSKTWTRAFFVVASALLLGQMMVSRRTDARHVGWLFVVFVLALLLDEVAWFRESEPRPSWKSGVLGFVLCVQVIAGVFAVSVSARHTFSGSKGAAEYLQARGLDKAPMVFVPDYVSLPILAYLQRPTAYYVERHAQGSIVVWDKAEWYGRHLPSRAELDAAAVGGQKPVLVMEKPLSDDKVAELGVQRIALISGEIYPEAYFIYR